MLIIPTGGIHPRSCFSQDEPRSVLTNRQPCHSHITGGLGGSWQFTTYLGQRTHSLLAPSKDVKHTICSQPNSGRYFSLFQVIYCLVYVYQVILYK